MRERASYMSGAHDNNVVAGKQNSAREALASEARLHEGLRTGLRDNRGEDEVARVQHVLRDGSMQSW